MKTPNLIHAREKRTEIRKIAKSFYDEQVDLSTDRKDSYRLLDEGTVVDANGRPWFYLAKGTIAKYLNGENEHLSNLDDDYVGHIDLGHMDFPTFPFVLGTWEREDLTLVDIGDGRQALNVSPKIDEDSVFIKELRKMPYSLGISAEFNVHYNEQMTEEVSETLGEYVPAYDEIYIKGFGIVGDAGNVNSGGLELKGEDMPNDVELTVDAVEVEEEVSEEANLEVGEVEEAVAESESEEAEAEELVSEEADEVYDELSVKIDNLIKENEELKSKLSVYEEKLRRQGKKLKAQAEKVESFNEKFPKLSVSMGLAKEEAKEESSVRYKTGDGIGEL